MVDSSDIIASMEGSDHCPIQASLRCTGVASPRCPSLATRFWPEFAGRQQSICAFLDRGTRAASPPRKMMKQSTLDKSSTSALTRIPVKTGAESWGMWKSLLPPTAPLCKGHREPSVLRTVKKRGPNLGRGFFVCARPKGHSDDSRASCNFFQWVHPQRTKPQ